MRIAICDNEPSALDFVSAAIEDIILYRSMDIQYESFSSYENLMPRISEFDLFIIDYKMPGISGLDFARKVYSKYGMKKGLIFITAYPEIVYEAFEVRSYRFLVKPLTKEKITDAVCKYISDLSSSKKLAIKYDDEYNILNIDDIYYMEAARKHTYIYLKYSYVTCRRSITSFEEELCECGFFRIHRSYLVNINKVKKFDSRICLLENGEKLFISQNKYDDFCRKYLESIK